MFKFAKSTCDEIGNIICEQDPQNGNEYWMLLHVKSKEPESFIEICCNWFNSTVVDNDRIALTPSNKTIALLLARAIEDGFIVVIQKDMQNTKVKKPVGPIRFIRTTHDFTGNVIRKIPSDKWQKMALTTHLTCEKPFSFDRIVAEHAKYSEDFQEIGLSRTEIAIELVLAIEAGCVGAIGLL